MSNILLVEPNTVLAKAYSQALERSGHRVVHVTGAQEAIDAADDITPDAVVLELQLSAHNGVEFLHEFRSYPEWQRVPIIVHTFVSPAALSASAESLNRQFGVTCCLYKPQTNLEQLADAVGQFVSS